MANINIFKALALMRTLSFIIFITMAQVSYAELTLRMLTWDGYAPASEVSAFQAYIKKKYKEDITLEINYVSHSDEYFEYIRNESVDIIAPSHNIILDERYQLIPRQLLLPINISHIPNYDTLIPSLKKATYTTVDNKIYSVPFAHGPYGLIYNIHTVPPPTSWNILWDQKYKNQYAVSYDYFEANVYITALALGVPKDKIMDISTLQKYDIKGKLIHLIKNTNNFWRGVDTADDLVNNNLSTSWGFSLPAINKSAINWKMADLVEGNTGWVDGHALVRTLKDKPILRRIAEEWINYSISKDFQFNVVIKQLGSSPVNLTTSDYLTDLELEKFHLNDTNYFKNNRILWPILTRRQRNYLKKLWDEALVEADKVE